MPEDDVLTPQAHPGPLPVQQHRATLLDHLLKATDGANPAESLTDVPRNLQKARYRPAQGHARRGRYQSSGRSRRLAVSVEVFGRGCLGAAIRLLFATLLDSVPQAADLDLEGYDRDEGVVQLHDEADCGN